MISAMNDNCLTQQLNGMCVNNRFAKSMMSQDMEVDSRPIDSRGSACEGHGMCSVEAMATMSSNHAAHAAHAAHEGQFCSHKALHEPATTATTAAAAASSMLSISSVGNASQTSRGSQGSRGSGRMGLPPQPSQNSFQSQFSRQSRHSQRSWPSQQSHQSQRSQQSHQSQQSQPSQRSQQSVRSPIQVTAAAAAIPGMAGIPAIPSATANSCMGQGPTNFENFGANSTNQVLHLSAGNSNTNNLNSVGIAGASPMMMKMYQNRVNPSAASGNGTLSAASAATAAASQLSLNSASSGNSGSKSSTLAGASGMFPAAEGATKPSPMMMKMMELQQQKNANSNNQNVNFVKDPKQSSFSLSSAGSASKSMATSNGTLSSTVAVAPGTSPVAAASSIPPGVAAGVISKASLNPPFVASHSSGPTSPRGMAQPLTNVVGGTAKQPSPMMMKMMELRQPTANCTNGAISNASLNSASVTSQGSAPTNSAGAVSSSLLPAIGEATKPATKPSPMMMKMMELQQQKANVLNGAATSNDNGSFNSASASSKTSTQNSRGTMGGAMGGVVGTTNPSPMMMKMMELQQQKAASAANAGGATLATPAAPMVGTAPTAGSIAGFGTGPSPMMMKMLELQRQKASMKNAPISTDNSASGNGTGIGPSPVMKTIIEHRNKRADSVSVMKNGVSSLANDVDATLSRMDMEHSLSLLQHQSASLSMRNPLSTKPSDMSSTELILESSPPLGRTEILSDDPQQSSLVPVTSISSLDRKSRGKNHKSIYASSNPTSAKFARRSSLDNGIFGLYGGRNCTSSQSLQQMIMGKSMSKNSMYQSVSSRDWGENSTRSGSGKSRNSASKSSSSKRRQPRYNPKRGKKTPSENELFQKMEILANVTEGKAVDSSNLSNMELDRKPVSNIYFDPSAIQRPRDDGIDADEAADEFQSLGSSITSFPSVILPQNRSSFLRTSDRKISGLSGHGSFTRTNAEWVTNSSIGAHNSHSVSNMKTCISQLTDNTPNFSANHQNADWSGDVVPREFNALTASGKVVIMEGENYEENECQESQDCPSNDASVSRKSGKSKTSSSSLEKKMNPLLGSLLIPAGTFQFAPWGEDIVEEGEESTTCSQSRHSRLSRHTQSMASVADASRPSQVSHPSHGSSSSLSRKRPLSPPRQNGNWQELGEGNSPNSVFHTPSHGVAKQYSLDVSSSTVNARRGSADLELGRSKFASRTNTLGATSMNPKMSSSNLKRKLSLMGLKSTSNTNLQNTVRSPADQNSVHPMTNSSRTSLTNLLRKPSLLGRKSSKSNLQNMEWNNNEQGQQNHPMLNSSRTSLGGLIRKPSLLGRKPSAKNVRNESFSGQNGINGLARRPSRNNVCNSEWNDGNEFQLKSPPGQQHEVKPNGINSYSLKSPPENSVAATNQEESYVGLSSRPSFTFPRGRMKSNMSLSNKMNELEKESSNANISRNSSFNLIRRPKNIIPSCALEEDDHKPSANKLTPSNSKAMIRCSSLTYPYDDDESGQNDDHFQNSERGMRHSLDKSNRSGCCLPKLGASMSSFNRSIQDHIRKSSSGNEEWSFTDEEMNKLYDKAVDKMTSARLSAIGVAYAPTTGSRSSTPNRRRSSGFSSKSSQNDLSKPPPLSLPNAATGGQAQGSSRSRRRSSGWSLSRSFSHNLDDEGPLIKSISPVPPTASTGNNFVRPLCRRLTSDITQDSKPSAAYSGSRRRSSGWSRSRSFTLSQKDEASSTNPYASGQGARRRSSIRSRSNSFTVSQKEGNEVTPSPPVSRRSSCATPDKGEPGNKNGRKLNIFRKKRVRMGHRGSMVSVVSNAAVVWRRRSVTSNSSVDGVAETDGVEERHGGFEDVLTVDESLSMLTSLGSHVDSQDWEKFRETLQANGKKKCRWVSSCNNEGNLFHRIVKHRPPSDIIEKMLSICHTVKDGGSVAETQMITLPSSDSHAEQKHTLSEILDERDELDRTPLHVAAASGCSLEVFEHLIRGHPTATTSCDNDGRSPLSLAIMWYFDPLELCSHDVDMSLRFDMDLTTLLNIIKLFRTTMNLYPGAVGFEGEDDCGYSPFDYAQKGDACEIILNALELPTDEENASQGQASRRESRRASETFVGDLEDFVDPWETESMAEAREWLQMVAEKEQEEIEQYVEAFPFEELVVPIDFDDDISEITCAFANIAPCGKSDMAV